MAKVSDWFWEDNDICPGAGCSSEIIPMNLKEAEKKAVALWLYLYSPDPMGLPVKAFKCSKCDYWYAIWDKDHIISSGGCPWPG